MDKKILIILIVIGVLVIGVLLFVFSQGKPQPIEPPPLVLPPIEREPAGFGGEVYGQVQGPAEQLPETNPFEAQTNPFEQETNPLRSTYTNPFE